MPVSAVFALGFALGIIGAASRILPFWLISLSLSAVLAFAAVLEGTRKSYWRLPVLMSVSCLLGAFSYELAAPEVEAQKTNLTAASSAYSLISANAERALGRDLSSLLLAIVFGDDTKVGSEERDKFDRSGLLHLFAASGFNVALAAAFIMLAARGLKAPLLGAAGLSLASIAFYYFLVGPSPSVIRAVIMSSLIYAAIYFGRKVDGIASTSVAAVVMLWTDPRSLFNIGWQLSFAGVFGILVVAPLVARLMTPGTGRLAGPIAVTVGAQLAVAPLVIYYFGRLSVIALAANPLLELAVAFVTGAGFLGGVLTLIWAPAGRAVFIGLGPALRVISQGVGLFAAFPGGTILIRPNVANGLIFAILTIALFIGLRRRPGRLRLWSVAIMVLGALAIGLWLNLGVGFQKDPLIVTFMDVDEGDATLIKTDGGDVILFDGGRDWRRLDDELSRRGIRRIDLLIATHAHADHIGALDELVRRYPVGMIIEPGLDHDTAGYNAFRRAVKAGNIPLKEGRSGRHLRIGEVHIDILWPANTFLRGTESDVNNNSIVAKVTYKKFKMLMAGDIQEEAIAELLHGPGDLRAQVLKVSHQGSANGTTFALLKRVKPKYAVISVGRDNPYGHPHPATLRRLKRFVRAIKRTDISGDAVFTSDGNRLQVGR